MLGYIEYWVEPVELIDQFYCVFLFFTYISREWTIIFDLFSCQHEHVYTNADPEEDNLQPDHRSCLLFDQLVNHQGSKKQGKENATS